MTTSTAISSSTPSNVTPASQNTTPCLKLKASLLPMTVLELLHFDTETINQELHEKTQQAPDFFENLPVVIDLEKLPSDAEIPFSELVALCLSFSIKVVAIRGGTTDQQSSAKAAGLSVLAKQKERQTPASPEQAPSAVTHVETVEVIKEVEVEKVVIQNQKQQSKMILTPIRSGQQVYAPDGDLIVMASVSAGAEILADGNIHVYGTLRGRALAGVKGDTSARIICQNLEAELVSVAGQYKISEDIDKLLLKKTTQVYLDNDTLCIKEIDF